MTTQEVLTRFKTEFERIASQAAPGYEPDEISTMLNIAMENLIVNRYTGNNPLQQGFEQTEKRIEDLANLIEYKNYTTFTTGFLPNSYSVTLPNTLLANPQDFSDVFWFIIYENCLSSFLNCNTGQPERILVKEVNHMELEDLLQDPFNKPEKDRWIFRNRTKNKVNLITDGNFQPVSYTVGYIRKPQPIDLTVTSNNAIPDVSDEMQREVITEAVYQAVKALADNRVQIYKQDLTTIE